MKFIPIIDMQNNPTLHNELKPINGSKNSWDYYFKKINNYSLEKVYKSKNVFFSSEKFEQNMTLNINDSQISKYLKKIRINNRIHTKVKKFIKKNFRKDQKILGVHFRGSTYKTARGMLPTNDKTYEKTNKLLNK